MQSFHSGTLRMFFLLLKIDGVLNMFQLFLGFLCRLDVEELFAGNIRLFIMKFPEFVRELLEFSDETLD